MMSRDQKSLLLFLEACAVDQGGAVNTAHMSKKDMGQAERWAKKGFIEWGRISMKHWRTPNQRSRSCWVRLSPEAWTAAHKERGERAERMWKVRSWKTTKEVRQRR